MRTGEDVATPNARVGLWLGVLGATVGLVNAWLLAEHPAGDNYVYGRPLLFSVLLLLLGAHAWRSSLPRTARGPRACTAVVTVGLALIAVGIVGDYWIGERNSVALWRLGFLFELLGSAGALLGTTVLGVLAVRARSTPAWVAWPMLLVLPIGWTLMVTVLGYIPSDPVGALCVAWGLACVQRAARRPLLTVAQR